MDTFRFIRICLLIALQAMFISGVNAQNMSINPTGAKPDSSAMLDVSSTSKGVLFPRMNQSQRNAITNPAHGLMVYQTDNIPGFYVYDTISTFWIKVLMSTDATLAYVLETGNDAAGDSIVNIGALSIGTSAPSSLVSIQGNGATAQVGITQNSLFTGSGMELTTNDGNGNQATRVFIESGNSNDIEFYTGNSGSETEVMHLEGSTNRVGIGLNSPAYKLDVNGTFSANSVNVNDVFTLPTVDGISNQVLTTNGSGTVSWQNAQTDNLGNHIATANLYPTSTNSYDLGTSTNYWKDFYLYGNLYHSNNIYMKAPNNGSTFLGASAGINSTGASNTFIGYGTGASITSGFSNVAVGRDALTGATTTGHNVAVGHGAIGASGFAGWQNVGVGFQSLASTQAGHDNSAIGYRSLYSNTTGSDNHGVGREVLYNNTTGVNNIAIGRAALYTKTTGSSNVAMGDEAGYYVNTSSGNNVFVGHQAGRGTTSHTKSGSVFIGYQAGYSETNSNRLYIDNTNTSSPLIWGDFANNLLNFNADVGIGTTSPSEMLHLSRSTDDAILRIDNPSASYEARVEFYKFGNNYSAGIGFYPGNAMLRLRTNSGHIAFEPDSVEVMRITTSSMVGIGVTSPSSKLDVDGDVEVGNSNFYYFGNPNTNGSWRIGRSGNNLVTQRREGGVWVTKSTITP